MKAFIQTSSNKVKALAALPIRTVTWVLTGIFVVWIFVDLTFLQLSSGLSQTTYDAMVKNRFYAAAPDPRLVIVDIDEASLAKMAKEFGRWPWPRDTLATVQDFIEAQAPLAIVWDVAFTDADKLSLGGDAAFNASAGRSLRSHYSVIRLPPANDDKSQLKREDLPSLWVKAADAGKTPATLAAIVPVLPNLAKGQLGFNNGYPDSDGVLRRYRYAEVLKDGAIIQSTPLSVAAALSKTQGEQLLAIPKNLDKHGADAGTLIDWRKSADAYPKVSFADVFAKAEGAKPAVGSPEIASFKGKVVVIGSTAPSLHDIHPTPLVAYQAGVESLANVIDNGMNHRILSEVPRWLQALIAIGLCVALAQWVRRFGIASLDGALVILPGALLGISYLSLNLLPVFLDLQLAAGAVLLFLAALRTWNNFRRNYWCAPPIPPSGSQHSTPYAAMWLQASGNAPFITPFADTGLDHLIDWLETHAPHCRIVGGDASSQWPAKLRWEEMATRVGIVGTNADLVHLKTCLPANTQAYDLLTVGGEPTKANIAKALTQY